MLRLSVRPLLEFRGEKPSVKYLQSLGIPYHTARYLLSDYVTGFNIDTIEKICIALKCTPNDIVFYRQGATELPAHHPLKELDEERFRNDIQDNLKKLGSEELLLVKEHLKALVNKKDGKEKER